MIGYVAPNLVPIRTYASPDAKSSFTLIRSIRSRLFPLCRLGCEVEGDRRSLGSDGVRSWLPGLTGTWFIVLRVSRVIRPGAGLSNCLTASLPHCLTASLPHCLTYTLAAALERPVHCRSTQLADAADAAAATIIPAANCLIFFPRFFFEVQISVS